MSTIRRADKILYLDFDGVLHDEDVWFHPKRGIYLTTPGRVLFEWVPILERLLDPHPDVAIVLSTSWVRARCFSYAKKQLSAGLQSRVIGATFHRRLMREDEFLNLSRGAQVASDVGRREPKSWFALDDDYVDWPEYFSDNLIRTDGRLGVSDSAVQEKIKVRLEQF